MNDAKHIGLDVHQATTSIAVLDSTGHLVMEWILETKAAVILQFVRGLRGNLHVTFEEGTCAVWKKEYNEERPHGSLASRTPAEFAREMDGEKGCSEFAVVDATHVQWIFGRHSPPFSTKSPSAQIGSAEPSWTSYQSHPRHRSEPRPGRRSDCCLRASQNSHGSRR
jgi:hypothetical protein